MYIYVCIYNWKLDNFVYYFVSTKNAVITFQSKANKVEQTVMRFLKFVGSCINQISS